MKLTDGKWEYVPVHKHIVADGLVIADTFFSDASAEEMDANGHVMAAGKQLLEVLKRYEEWEAKLLMDDDLWNPDNNLPAFSQELYDEWMEIQALRNQAIEAAQQVTQVEA